MFACAGKDVADRWYDEVKQYNFNRPGFSSGTGEIHAHLSLTVFFHLLFFQFVAFSVSLSFFVYSMSVSPSQCHIYSGMEKVVVILVLMSHLRQRATA